MQRRQGGYGHNCPIQTTLTTQSASTGGVSCLAPNLLSSHRPRPPSECPESASVAPTERNETQFANLQSHIDRGTHDFADEFHGFCQTPPVLVPGSRRESFESRQSPLPRNRRGRVVAETALGKKGARVVFGKDSRPLFRRLFRRGTKPNPATLSRWPTESALRSMIAPEHHLYPGRMARMSLARRAARQHSIP